MQYGSRPLVRHWGGDDGLCQDESRPRVGHPRMGCRPAGDSVPHARGAGVQQRHWGPRCQKHAVGREQRVPSGSVELPEVSDTVRLAVRTTPYRRCTANNRKMGRRVMVVLSAQDLHCTYPRTGRRSARLRSRSPWRDSAPRHDPPGRHAGAPTHPSAHVAGVAVAGGGEKGRTAGDRPAPFAPNHTNRAIAFEGGGGRPQDAPGSWRARHHAIQARATARAACSRGGWTTTMVAQSHGKPRRSMATSPHSGVVRPRGFHPTRVAPERGSIAPTSGTVVRHNRVGVP